MRELILKIIIFVSIFLTFSSVYASDIYIYPDAKELLITVMYGKNEGEGHLKIKNNSVKDIPIEIKASDLIHNKEKDNVANLSFIHDGKEINPFHTILKKQATEPEKITFRVSKINLPGEFTGTIELKVAGKPARTLSVKVGKATLQPVDVLEAKNGKLNLKMEKPEKRNFPITINNSGEYYREIALQDLELKDNGKTITGQIQPDKTIKLEPKQQKTINIFFSEIPKGSYKGILIIRDNYSYKEYPITLFSPFGFLEIPYVKMDRYIYVDLLYAILLVFAGAMVSIILTKFVPIASDKRKNREKIVELRGLIDMLTAFEPKLKIKFTVELVEAQKINDNTKIYNPSAGERIKKVKESLTKLENYLAIRKSISDLYIEIDSRDYLPFSIEEKIRNKLRDADLKLYEGEENIAKQLKEQASKEFEFDRKKFCENLQEDIRKFLEAFKKEEHGKKDVDPFIIDLIVKLQGEVLPCIKLLKIEDAEEQKKEEYLENLRKCELIWQKVNIYCNRLLKTQDYKLKEEEVLKLLKSDNHNDLLKALKICNSLDYGVTEEKIVEAIEKHKFCIKSYPSDPDVNGFIKFWLEFEEDKLNDSQLLNDFRYVWDFDDMTKKAEGIEVYHYFTRRGMFILFRKWMRRNYVIFLRSLGKWGWEIAEKKQIWREFRISVEISRFSSNCSIIQKYPNLEPLKPLKVREPLDKPYRSGITFLDIFGFIAVFTLSCLITATNIYDEKFSFTSFKDVISAFLIGFGLEVSRENLSKLIETRKGK
ncbi:MAG: hypothetical protein AB1480_05280 [Nitrospirota bacterium]